MTGEKMKQTVLEDSMYDSAQMYQKRVEQIPVEQLMWKTAKDIFHEKVLSEKQKRPLVLDLCCGPGVFAKSISPACPGQQVTGVDINKRFVEFCSHKWPQWKFICQNVLKLKLNSSFNYVLASSAYHHMRNKEKKNFLVIAKKHLAPNGRIMVCENFLPKRKTRFHAIKEFYTCFLQCLKLQHASFGAVAAVREAQSNEIAGKEEHKVTFKRFTQDCKAVGLFIEKDISVWQLPAWKKSNAGSHVIVLAKKQNPKKTQTVSNCDRFKFCFVDFAIISTSQSLFSLFASRAMGTQRFS
ncbi:MAG: class I SAM-dependent methyltransferase [Candidatus Woesearchaeota archaeon]|nr:class I SAM-dependent methyltransferase [Candidatus Woesearchaeota archaeon]